MNAIRTLTYQTMIVDVRNARINPHTHQRRDFFDFVFFFFGLLDMRPSFF